MSQVTPANLVPAADRTESDSAPCGQSPRLDFDAALHRNSLPGVWFIGITGSCGKTTTKNLTAAVLGSRWHGEKSVGTKNCGPHVEETIFRVSPAHQYCVQELGAWGPGTLDHGIALLLPRIGVVLNVRNDHHSGFRSLQNTLTEKRKLIECLPEDGWAILNHDDQGVLSMRAATHARVLTFGTHRDADLLASEVSSPWPSRLTFRLQHGRKVVRISTQLVGKHVIGSALAAVGVGIALGMSLDEAAAAIEHAGTTWRRLSPVSLGDGVTFLRDDYKATEDSMAEVLELMTEAHAPRKIGVFGQISDYHGRSRRTYNRVALAALNVLDAVVFVGRRAEALWASDALDGRSTMETIPPGPRGSFHVFGTVQSAADFLKEYLRAGDLVLLKGSGPADHLERIVLDRTLKVLCWAENCGRLTACDKCEQLRSHSASGCR